MTTEEKLEKFYDLVTDKAQKDGDRILAEYQGQLDGLYADHCSLKKQQADQAVYHDGNTYQREMNKVLSEEQLSLRKELTALKDSLTEKVFAEVSEKLEAFRKSPDYLPFLCKKIEAIRTYLGNDEALYYLDGTDAALIPSVAEKCGVTPEVADRPILGGVLAVSPSRNIEIDETFASALANEKDAFIINEKEDET